MVGYTMISYGLVDAICSYSFNPLTKRIGRLPVFTVAFLLNVAMIIVLSTVPAGSRSLTFIIVAFWAISDAVWQTQINSKFYYSSINNFLVKILLIFSLIVITFKIR